MPLVNLAWKSSFFWDGRASSLREQVLDPIRDPIELHSDLDQLVEQLSGVSDYPDLFLAAFGDEAINTNRLAVALEQFMLTLTSMDSRFDQAAAGKAELTEQEKRGFELFMTEYDPRREQYGADCFHCHGGAFFTDHAFHNNGLEAGEDGGLEIATGRASDRYKFSTPSLRNVALTAPYMHDGRFDTLEEVITHYVSGLHRSPTLDPNLAKHPARGIPLTIADQQALLAFLKTLSDPQFAETKLQQTK
jgi:cytochrome c peroxidase